MAKYHDPTADAKALVDKLEAEANEPTRKLEAARAELARIQSEHDAADRADRLARLPTLAQPATFEAFKASADPLVARTIAQVTALRDTLIEADNLIAQQELVATGAIAEAAALGVPAPCRVIGRGLLRGLILDSLRGFGAFNLHLYLAFPTESDRDAAIVQGVNLGDTPPVGMSIGDFARELLSGRTSGEIHSDARRAEAEREQAIRAAERKAPVFDLQERATSWFGNRRTSNDDQPPPPEAA